MMRLLQGQPGRCTTALLVLAVDKPALLGTYGQRRGR